MVRLGAVSESGSESFTLVSLDAPVNPASIQFEVALKHVPKGDYTVHFRALDIRNQWSSLLSRTIEKEAIAVAAFSVSSSTCVGSAIQFTNESLDADIWLWEFGDGNTSTEFEPEHIYAEAGEFNVKLEATDSKSGKNNSVIHAFTIHSIQENLISAEICASELPYIFGTQQLNKSGIYTETFQSVHGCDSLVTLNLTVNPTYNVTIGGSSNFQVNDNFEEDALGTLAGWTIKYNANAPITGETNQSFAPDKNGNYALEVTEMGCIETSSCYSVTSVGILENSYETEIVIYPNPINGRVIIELGDVYPETVVTIHDMNGRLLHQHLFKNANKLQIDIDNMPGVYLMY